MRGDLSLILIFDFSVWKDFPQQQGAKNFRYSANIFAKFDVLFGVGEPEGERESSHALALETLRTGPIMERNSKYVTPGRK